MKPKYPNIRVNLVGEDGNAFAILGRVQNSMRRAGVPKEEIDKFIAETDATPKPVVDRFRKLLGIKG